MTRWSPALLFASLVGCADVLGLVGCADVLGLDDFAEAAGGGAATEANVSAGAGGIGGAMGGGGTTTTTRGAGGGGGAGGEEPLPSGTPLFVRGIVDPGIQRVDHLALGPGDRFFVGGEAQPFSVGSVDVDTSTNDAFLLAFDGMTPVVAWNLDATNMGLRGLEYDASLAALRIAGGFTGTLALPGASLTQPDPGLLGFAASLDGAFSTTSGAMTLVGCGSTATVRTSSWGDGTMAFATGYTASSCSLEGMVPVGNAGFSNGDVFVGVVDADGQGLRQCGFGGTSSEGVTALAAMAPGYVAVTGTTSGSFSTPVGAIAGGSYILGLGPSGGAGCSVQWAQELSSGNEVSVRAVQYQAGFVYVAGTFNGETDFGGLTGSRVPVGQDTFVMQLSQGGAFQWLATSNGGNFESVESLAVGADGTVYLTGQFRGDVGFGAVVDPPGELSGYLVALAPVPMGLEPRWVHTLIGSGNALLGAMAVDERRLVATGAFTTPAELAGQSLSHAPDAAYDVVVAAFTP